MTDKRVVEIQCKKCGEMYDRNYKACPNCGFNPFRHYLKVVGITAFVALFITNLVFTILVYARQNDIANRLSTIEYYQSTESSNSSSLDTDITNYTFYNDYVLYENAVLDNLGEDYFLYFHSEDCSHCLEANGYVLSYYNIPVSKDSDDYIYDEKPVYFVTVETNEQLFNQFNIDSTPTMVRMNGPKEVERVVGSDEISELLGKIVKEYYPE